MEWRYEQAWAVLFHWGGVVQQQQQNASVTCNKFHLETNDKWP